MAKDQTDLVNKHLPAIGIINSMRSGGNMLNRLLDSHPQLLTNHSETFFGIFSDSSEKSNYQLRRFKENYDKNFNIKKIFRYLIENDFNHISSSKHGWVKTNYNQPLRYNYNYDLHYKHFHQSLKNFPDCKYRKILDIYTSSFFESFSNLNTSKKKYFNTYWPNFSLYKTNIKNFFKIYPDGHLIFIVRDPLQWAASCKKRRPNQFSIGYVRSFYEKPILNCLDFIKSKSKILIVDFDDLIFNTQNTMMMLLKQLKLDTNNSISTKPTFHGKRIIGNSINSELRTFKINKKITKKYKSILTKNERDNITKKFNKCYQEIIRYKISN